MPTRPTSRAAAATRSLLASVDATLHAYADRGVFRGYSAADGPRGLRIYRFTWLTKRPMVVTLSPAQRVLTFVRLFPAVVRTSGVASALKTAVAAASSRGVPAHRRFSPRRGTISGRLTGGDLSLRVTVGTGNGAPVVRAALAVVNDLFLLLHECYPDYLTAQFGVTDE